MSTDKEMEENQERVYKEIEKLDRDKLVEMLACILPYACNSFFLLTQHITHTMDDDTLFKPENKKEYEKILDDHLNVVFRYVHYEKYSHDILKKITPKGAHKQMMEAIEFYTDEKDK